MRRKKTLLVLVLIGTLLVLGGIGGGLWWFYQNSGGRLLRKADLAIRAGKHERAAELAAKYMEDRPADWQGPYYQARAYAGMGRYEEARKSLERAAKIAPAQSSIAILGAATYSEPAKKAIVSKDLSQVRQAVEQFRKAEDVLAEAVARADANQSDKGADLPTKAGLARIETGQALGVLAGRLREEELVAKGRGDANSVKFGVESNEVEKKRTAAIDGAAGVLLAVVQRDANRAEAATALVQLCLERRDANSLAAAREAIRNASDPAPVAAMLLAMEDLQPSIGQTGPTATDMQKAKAACQVLDDILAKHPDNTQVKLVRADLAVRSTDLTRADQLCQEVLKTEPRNPRARLLQAQVLMARKDLAGAEKMLATLKSDVRSADVLFAYARVALALGKRDAALESLGAMSKLDFRDSQAKLRQAQLALDLSDLAMARQLCQEVLQTAPGNAWARLLYGTVLAQGGNLPEAEREFTALRAACPQWPEAHIACAEIARQRGDAATALAAVQKALELDPENAAATRLKAGLQVRSGDASLALDDAQKFHQAHPDDPGALLLLVEAAVRSRKPDLARVALERTVADFTSKPEMLMTACDGYLAINDRAAAMKVAKDVAEANATAFAGRMAKVRALELTGRLPEADRLLNEEWKKDPTRADVRFRLGRTSAATGRAMVAVDHYRAAVELDRAKRRVPYRACPRAAGCERHCRV